MAQPQRAHRWATLRQDSGDPFAFGPSVKAMYESIGIAHESKTLVYSDALTVEKCLAIKKQCDELEFHKGDHGPCLKVQFLNGRIDGEFFSFFWNRNIPHK